MRNQLLSILYCPKCKSDLFVTIDEKVGDEIIGGNLQCFKCQVKYPIKNSIPRFITYNYYADSFGIQWKTFVKTQLDDNNKTKESHLRFKTELGWDENNLKGKLVVELGSGAGRFVDVVSKSGAKLVVGVDATDAVDAAWMNLSNRANVAFVQADIFELPFKDNVFDYSYSIGVLHHTSDPHLGYLKMTEITKNGGFIGLSLYERTLYKRPSRDSLKILSMEVLWAINLWRCEFFRVFTTRMPKKVFLNYCKLVVPFLHKLNKVPILRYSRYLLPSTCYKSLPVEWSILDTHDTYATKIVNRYNHKEIFHWFLKEGMDKIIIHNGRTGWVSITGIKTEGEEKERMRIVENEPDPL